MLGGPPPLTNAPFRATIAQVSQDVAESPGSEDLTQLVQDARIRLVDPAIAQIQQEHDALKVRRTLIRVMSDRVSVASAASSTLALAAGGGGTLEAMIHAVLAAQLIAAAAKEADYRLQLKSELRVRPFWLLHEANGLLR